jgi:hypothetical protein
MRALRHGIVVIYLKFFPWLDQNDHTSQHWVLTVLGLERTPYHLTIRLDVLASCTSNSVMDTCPCVTHTHMFGIMVDC